MNFLKLKDIAIVLVSILVLFGLFLYVNPGVFFQKLISLSLYTILALVLLFLIDLTFRVLRWYVLLLSQEHNLPFKALMYPSFAANFLNLILPGRLGDLIRLYALRDKYQVTYSVGLSVIVVEQVINLMSLIIVASLAMGLILISGINLKYEILNSLLPYAFLGFLIIIAGIALLFIIDPNKFIPLFSFLPEKINAKVVRLIHTFAFGLKTIKSKFYIFWLALGSSMIIWIIEGIMIWLLTLHFISPKYEFQVALFASNIGNLNFLFPVLPGAAGTYELFLAFVLSLSPLYVGTYATSVGFADRIIKTAILAVLGVISLLKLGSDTFTVIRRKTKEVQQIEEVKKEFAD